jgi:Spx/MgsR family transcriptional regulator
MPTEPIFYYKSTCTTCRRARALLRELGVGTRERDMSKQPLSLDELKALVGDREIKPFLNPRNELYRERGMARQTPSKDEALALMAENPNLIRRPLLVSGGEILFGLDEPGYQRLAGKQ